MASEEGTTGAGADTGDRVVVRAQQGLRVLGTVVLGPLAVGIVLALVEAVRAGDPGAPMDRTGWSPSVVLGWTVSVLVLAGAVLALGVLWSYRVTLDAGQVTWRLLGRHRRTALADVARVEVLARRPRSIAGDIAGALVVRDRRGGVVATFRPSETAWPAVLGILAGWAQRRPDLVRDEGTAALLVAAGSPHGP